MTSTATPATATPTIATCTAPKTVYLIRHAESEENRRLGSLKACFGALGRFSLPTSTDVMASMSLINVPAQVDSDVSSPVGKAQIAQLADQLQAAHFTNYLQLVAHSPLKRAQQTCDGMLQCSATASGGEVRKSGAVQRVLELESLTEKTPTEWIISSASLYNRIQDFETWLSQQEEETIAIVGHSQYFKAMLEMDFKFGNCDVWQIQFGGTQQQQESEYKTPRAWSGLKKLYSYQPPAFEADGGAPVVDAAGAGAAENK